MDLSISPRAAALRERLAAFMEEHIDPIADDYERELHGERADRWAIPPVFYELQGKAKAAGLWNLFLPHAEYGAPGLTNLEYAPLAEVMGRVNWAPEVFNCNAPDSGNMELLIRFGTPEQKAKYLEPMAEGRTKSVFCMTEPDVASSDATNIRTSITRDGDFYVINGRKWWSTNAYNPRTAFYIVMGKTDPDAPTHLQQSQILVDPATPGITLKRALPIFGFHDEPHGHGEIVFENVRVPAANMVLGEGRGFEISQARLGPGRIHHCMRIIGVAEKLLEMLCKRLLSRTAFGKLLSDQSLWQERIAVARTEIEMCRLLVLKAAYMMDTVGNRVARSEIAQIKVAVPLMAQRLCDVTMQAHGAAGVCDDFGLAFAYARLRVMRLGDGPDEVHNRTIARTELDKYRPKREKTA
jgi:acyl-CoA dehydrogenase